MVSDISVEEVEAKLWLSLFHRAQVNPRSSLLSEAEEQLEIEMKSVADVFRKDETTKMVNGVEPRCSFCHLRLMTQCETVGNWQIDRSG